MRARFSPARIVRDSGFRIAALRASCSTRALSTPPHHTAILVREDATRAPAIKSGRTAYRGHSMNVTEAAEGIQRAASAAQNGGAVMTFGAGASIPVTQYLGLSLVEWQIAGIVCGIGIGVAGLVVNTVFAYLRYRRGE